MPFARPTSWLPVAGLLVSVGGVLGWLLLGFAGAQVGKLNLPDATSGAIVEGLVGQQTDLPLAEVQRLPASEWKRWRGGDHIVGRHGIELWLRLTVHNRGDVPQAGVLDCGDYFADRVEAWLETNDGKWTRLISGEAVADGEKALSGRDLAFPVIVPARGERVVYLRVTDFFGPVTFPAWWPDERDFHAAKARGLLAEGVYLGGLLALLGYNAMLWLRLRQADIGWYTGCLAAAAAFMILARGQIGELGWAMGSPGLEIALTLAIALSGLMLTGFAREFLELKTRAVRLDRLAFGVQLLLLALAVGAFAMPWMKSATMLKLVIEVTGITHVSLLVLAVWSWRTGVRQARFLVLSFGCLFSATLPAVAIWLSGGSHKNLAVMGVMIGSALEMLVLSLAVADRFAQAQRARAEAQARLVEETEQRRAIEEAYADELEVEVRERTRELEEANTDKDRILTVIGHDLRGPLTGLTQTAELLTSGGGVGAASPAALDGFAGDAAKLGRQVLLLIEDLVLWARLRTGRASPPTPHRVRAIVAPVVALHRTLAGQRGIALTVEVAEELRVTTDLVLAQTLLRNLVANALKFARGEVVVSARARSEAEGGGAELTVRDDGPGLPAAVLAGFAGGAGAGAGAEGGLGLRLCIEIGRALDANVAVQSIGGNGTEFKFVLPTAAPEASEIERR
jgi:signal transduction histidine kinase